MSIQSSFPDIRPSLNLDFANSKALDPRITFSRASAATFYDGKTTAKAEENLLLGSQDFSNTYWSYQLSTSYALNTQTAPDGSITADTVTFAGISTSDAVYQNISANSVNGDIYTASVWLRAAAPVTVNLIIERLGPADTVIQTCNVTTTWTRFSLTHTGVFSGSSAVRFKLSTPSAICDIYVWGAQLEKRSSFTAYTPTTTQPITNYIPALQYAAAGVPRFDHDPITGECKGLLIEEQRTNLLTYSEQFDNAVWSKTNATVTANAVVAPDGILTADLIDIQASGYMYQSITQTYSAGAAYTWSLHVKSATRAIKFGGATPAGTDVYSAIPVGNGWYRQILTRTFTGAGSGASIQAMVDAGTFGVGSVAAWGAQLEVGAFPTSYIPTQASQVTRSADSASMTGANFSSWYRQDEGTIVAEFNSVSGGTALKPVFSIDGGSQANEWLFGRTQAISFFWTIDTNNTNQGNSTTSIVLDANNKAAFGLTRDDIAIYLNGSLAVTDTSAVTPTLVDRLRIGCEPLSRYANSTIKRIAYYPKRLTNAQLQSLTA